MERVNTILHNEIFLRELGRIDRLERERIYCRHGLPHLLDVARTAYILCLERGASVSQELLYAAALLHDIGRAEQYESGIPHEQAGVPIAQSILQDTSFSAEEQACILDCVRCHHGRTFGGTALLDLIFEADKRSRPCYCCPAADSCNWKLERRNRCLTV
ncbi:MAG: HD domain-containing protein [Butyricicoccus sp.]